MAVSIEPISVCNLKCPECPTGLGTLLRAKGTMSLGQFQLLLPKLNKALWHVNLYFQGEPYMHPDFFRLVELSKLRRLVISASTNGQYLSKERALKTVESGLDLLTISFDGITQDVYQKYRINGELSKVIEGTKHLVAAKKRLKKNYPIISAQFLVFKHNEHQIDDFIKLARDLGVDKVDLKTAQIYESPNAKSRLTSVSKYSRYELATDNSVTLKGDFKNGCWKAWSSSVITWDGNVIPCCFDKDASHIFGNVFTHNLPSIVGNKADVSFKKKLFKQQYSLGICQNCPISRK